MMMANSSAAHCRLRRLAAGFMLLGAAHAHAELSLDGTVELREMRDATWHAETGNGGPDLAKGKQVRLPNPDFTHTVPSWYRLTFTLAKVPVDTQAIYFPGAFAHLELYVNDHSIGATGLMTAEIERGWKAARLFEVPANFLRVGENVLLIRTGGIGAWTFAAPQFGDLVAADAKYTRRIIGTAVAPLAVGMLVALLGAFVLLLWLHRRAENLYAYFGIASFVCGLHMAWWMLPNPLFPQPHNRILWIATYTFWVSLMIMFFVRYTGQPSKYFVRGLWIYALAGYPIIYAAHYLGVFSEVSLAWRATGIVAVIGGLAIVVRYVWRERRGDGILLLLTGMIATSFGIHDWWTGQTSAGLFNRVPLVPYAGLAFVLMFGWLLAVRVNRNVDALALANHNLGQRVDEKTRALDENYQRLREAERLQTTLEERGRILRDMHDGLGTKLMISLRTLERGQVGNEAAAVLVRDCLDELRLTVDVYDQSDGSLATLLGNLRYRLGDRLAQAGLLVEWQVNESPPLPTLEGGGGRELMRIVQECLANTFHHARATKVTFSTEHRADAGRVRVTIRDNGVGIAAPQAGKGGHGLANMRTRAARLGGELVVESDSTGTAISINLPTATSGKVHQDVH